MDIIWLDIIAFIYFINKLTIKCESVYSSVKQYSFVDAIVEFMDKIYLFTWTSCSLGFFKLVSKMECWQKYLWLNKLLGSVQVNKNMYNKMQPAFSCFSFAIICNFAIFGETSKIFKADGIYTLNNTRGKFMYTSYKCKFLVLMRV